MKPFPAVRVRSAFLRATPAALLLALAGCAGREPPDLLLISIDTLRADHLGCYGHDPSPTPVIDALAGEGVLFEQVTSPAPLTLPSHATMLTGLTPLRHGVRNNEGFSLPAEALTLSEILHDAGYRTGAFIGGSPLARVGGLDQGFDHFDDRMEVRRVGEGPGLGREERDAEQVLGAALDWLRGAPPERPVFAFVHLFDPHQPYDHPLHGETVGSYDGDVAHADQALGSFLARLREEPRWQRAILLLTSDHGESLGEHGESSHGMFVYQATQRVPWILHGVPGLTPGRRQAPVGLVDIAPTLLDLAGLRVPPGLDGLSILGEEISEERGLYMETLLPALGFGWSPLHALRRGQWKLIAAPRAELYDLETDPAEQRDLHAAEPARATSLAGMLAERRAQEVPRTDAGSADAEHAERLRSLGYLSAPPVTAEEVAADPKDRIDAYEALRAAHLAAQQDPGEGLRRFAALAPAFERSAVYFELWGDVAVRARDLPAAAAHYRRAVALDPAAAPVRLDLGVALGMLGRPAEALAQFRLVLADHPDDPRALFLAGSTERSLGQSDEARVHLNRLLDVAPDHPLAATARGMIATEAQP